MVMCSVHIKATAGWGGGGWGAGRCSRDGDVGGMSVGAAGGSAGWGRRVLERGWSTPT